MNLEWKRQWNMVCCPIVLLILCSLNVMTTSAPWDSEKPLGASQRSIEASGGHFGSQEGHLGSQVGHWCWKNQGNHWGSQRGHMELQGHRAQGCQFGPHRGKKWIKFKNHKGLAAWGCYVVKNSKIISFHLEFCVSNNWNCCQKFSLFFCRTWGTWGGEFCLCICLYIPLAQAI